MVAIHFFYRLIYIYYFIFVYHELFSTMMPLSSQFCFFFSTVDMNEVANNFWPYITFTAGTGAKSLQ